MADARRIFTGWSGVLHAPGARIPPTLYGIFFEEISHAGDGGLYAELIQNRGFEDANLPPACVLDPDGFIVPPRTPHFDTGKPNTWRLRWDIKSPHPAWTLDATGGSEARIALSIEQPLHERTPHSLEVDIARIGAGGRVALLNEGYWGIGATKGAEYPLAFHLRRAPDASKGPIVPTLEATDGTTIAAVAPGSPMSVSGQPDGWQRFEFTLRATATDPKARLALTFSSPGRVWIDMVSLFPAKTF